MPETHEEATTGTDVGAKIAEADATADREADAFLAKLAGDDDTTPAEPAADTGTDGARDENGRFKKKTKDTKTPAPQGGDDDDSPDTREPEADAPPATDTVNPDEYRRALAALQRAKTPSTVLDEMDPADVTAWGLDLAAQQAETDAFGKQLADLRAGGKPKPEATTSGDMPDVDLAAAVAPFVEYFGDDVSEPLTAFGQALIEKFTGQLAPVVKQLQAQQHEAARERLSKTFDLDRDDRWQRVLTRRAADTNPHSNEYEALGAACRLEFSDELIANYEAKLQKQHRLRSNGQSSTEHKGKQPRTLTTEDTEDKLLEAIQDGDEAGIRKWAGRRPQPSLGQMGFVGG